MWIILETKFGDMKIPGVGPILTAGNSLGVDPILTAGNSLGVDPILTAGNSLGVDPILNVGKCCFTLCDSQ